MEPESVLKALDNENNERIIKYTSKCIREEKNYVLKEIADQEQLIELKRKLKPYRYCHEMDDICFGRYIRWIPVKYLPEVKLTNGGIVTELKIIDDSLYIVCKNNMNRFFQLAFEDNLIFSKLTSQENIILKVLDYIEK